MIRAAYDTDVVILGAGLAGSMMGAVLARGGAAVTIIDSGHHPRFSIGESTIPYTLVGIRTIAERYGVPEFKNICSFSAFNKHVGRTSGIKKHFGFIIHRPGCEPDPMEASQFNTPRVLHDSSHFFRQDVDSYLFHLAIKYGCKAIQSFAVDHVESSPDVITVVGKDSSKIRARYLIDGSAFRSVLGTQFGLRETPCRFKHHSRSLFTHMIDVPKVDEALQHTGSSRPPLAWNLGTMHHMFDGGWFWVIPFNNHKASQNPLVSVGLTMDNRRFPINHELTPEEEFFEFCERFPAVARQFRGARSVRPWVRTDRLQYSSTSAIGPRFCLMPHAYGFIDPLFSRGLSNTAEFINVAAWRLLDALRDDDFSNERFQYLDDASKGLLLYNDQLVNSAFISMRDYFLWNAVFKIWAYGSMYGTYRLQNALLDFRKYHDDDRFKQDETVPHLGLMWPDHEGFFKVFDTMNTLCESVDDKLTTAEDAANKIFKMLQEADFIPHPLGFSDPNVRFLHPTPLSMLKTIGWAMQSPPELRGTFLRIFVELGKSILKGDRLF